MWDLIKKAKDYFRSDKKLEYTIPTLPQVSLGVAGNIAPHPYTLIYNGEYEALPEEYRLFADLLEMIAQHNIDFTTELLSAYVEYLATLKIKKSYLLFSNNNNYTIKETFRDFYIQYTNKKFNEKLMSIIKDE